MKVPARDGRPMKAIAPNKDIVNVAKGSVEFDERQERDENSHALVEPSCSTGFLFLENPASNMSAIVPFVGALFGLSRDVQGPIIMASPPPAERDIENKVIYSRIRNVIC